LAAGKGAEWSLFWPGSGIRLISCSRLIVVLVRPAAGSGLVAVAGNTAESADGTEVSAVLEGEATLGTGTVLGSDGTGGVLLHAPKTNTNAKRAMAFIDQLLEVGADAWSISGPLESSTRLLDSP
jgi:hypothetical protein